ncbi:MAG: hypothetical protein OEV55_07760 [candidate division Zixibacteria bacterium]|nr:hypothetical protein [candidate division Zixibacteria bacterium]
MTGKKIKIFATLLCISLISFSSAFPQLCQEAKEMEKSCCCCGENSSELSWFDLGQKDDCGCQMKEKPKTESQAAIFYSYQNTRTENSLFISDITFTTQEFFKQSKDISSEEIYFPIKGPPLYILNSSFII